jgi:hypothetical protein
LDVCNSALPFLSLSCVIHPTIAIVWFRKTAENTGQNVLLLKGRIWLYEINFCMIKLKDCGCSSIVPLFDHNCWEIIYNITSYPPSPTLLLTLHSAHYKYI